MGPEEYFLLSRIDGATATRDVILGSGLAIDDAVKHLTRLRSLGALLLPGETAPPTPTVAPLPAKPAARFVPTPDEARLLAVEVDIPVPDREELLRLRRLIACPPHELLGIAQDDAKGAKLAYLQLSKRLHPDRFYKRNVGPWAPILNTVFEALTRANREVAAIAKARSQSAGSSQAAHAANLYEQACSLEMAGDHPEALKLFAACIKLDEKIRYLKRAASCANAFEQYGQAESYALRALEKDSADASAARLLAAAYRGQERYDEAASTLGRALEMRLEHDTILTELKRDLQEVRKLLVADSR